MADSAQNAEAHNRLMGSLVGLAIGDALGLPVEGMESEQVLGFYKATSNPLRSRKSFSDVLEYKEEEDESE